MLFKFGTNRARRLAMADNRKGLKMWFLIKGSFWFSLVLIALPLFSSESRDALEQAPPLEVGESMAAALEAFDDIRQICVRKPEVCETGGETFAALGIRAKEGARIAYEFLDSKFAGADDGLVTGSLPADGGQTATN